MDGTELQANMMSTALDDFPLRNGARGLDIALIALLGLLPLGLALRLRRRPALIAPAVLVAAALFCVAAQLAFGGGRVISTVYPLASLALASIGVAGVLALLHVKARAAKARAEATPRARAEAAPA
jgi:CHASE2 domain-containing sensor protein